MDYIFDYGVFESNFNVKKVDEVKPDSLRLYHYADKMFRLFPYKATSKAASPIVDDLSQVISTFFQLALGTKTESMSFESLCQNIVNHIAIEEEDIEYLKKIIYSFFFKDDEFVANNIGLYIYQLSNKNKSVERLAFFLFCIFDLDIHDCEEIKRAANKYTFNVLEKMVMDFIPTKTYLESNSEKKYFTVYKGVQQNFKKDFKFMLSSGMTEPEDISNLLSIYYFFYVSQTCLVLDKFCEGNRNDYIKLYYALDWEKVSRNRLCCKSGWEALQPSVYHIFCHAITLELINQHSDEHEMYDYIMLNDYIDGDIQKDYLVSKEIEKVGASYTSCIGDYNGFSELQKTSGELKTNDAIKHLFKCVEAQFLNTDRKRPNQFYVEKFTEFCKSRWLKNRSKSGYVLNLTERDVIFLTKICIRDQEKMRLNSLFLEYEKRGINLDSTSKEYLQEYFTKLNLIDKKSDSGDAQYVKRIL